MPLPRCERCALPTGWCICDRVPRLQVGVALSCIRHAAERSKQSNSVRLAALALPALAVHDYGAPPVSGPPRPFDPGPLIRPGTALLYPDPTGTAPVAAPADVRHLLLVDGTWAQTRRMVQRMPALAALPRLAIDPPAESEDQPRLRRPRRADGLATAEALAAALRVLGEAEAADALDDLFADFVQRGLSLRGLAPHPDGVDPRTHLHRPRLPPPPHDRED